MKKPKNKARKSVVTAIIVICLAVVIAAVVCIAVLLPKRSNPTDGFSLQEVDGYDAKNETNLCSWQQIPIVSQDILDSGNAGGEGGQWPLCLSGDNNDGNLMFYGTNTGGLYRSTDGGKSWHKAIKDLLCSGVCDVEIDPNNENRVICYGVNGGHYETVNGIYLSTDAGESWDHQQYFPINASRNLLESIAYDPSSYSEALGGSSILYFSLVEKTDLAGTPPLTDKTRGLYKSTDGGKSFTQIAPTLGDGIVKVTDSGVVYVASADGLYYSRDGINFELRLSGNVTGLDVVGDTVYALVDDFDAATPSCKIYKIDGNETVVIGDLKEENVDLTNLSWQDFYVKEGNDALYTYHFSPSVHRLYSLKVSPVNQNNMILAYQSTAYSDPYYSFNTMHSSDGGKTWQASVRNDERERLGIKDNNIFPYNIRQMDFYWSRTDENKVWDFQNDFISSSTDGGHTFLWDSNGLNAVHLGGKFNFNIFDNDLFYFGSQDYNGAVTNNGGKTWEYVNLSGNKWGGFVYGGYAASQNILFGGLTTGWYDDRYLAISFDGGKTVESHIGEEAYRLDSGKNKRLNQQANFVSYQAFNDRNVLFCGNLRSPDAGKSWARMKGITGVFAHDSENGDLYGLDDNSSSVVVSKDNGASWNVVVSYKEINPWWENLYISDLAFDSKNKVVYVTTDWSKLYKITVADKKVEELTENIPLPFQKEGMPEWNENTSSKFFKHRLLTVAVDPNRPEIIYVGGASYGYTSDSGIFRSCDGGKTFYNLTSNSSNSIIKFGEQGGFEPMCMRVKSNGELWMAGGCLGFCKLEAPYETDLSKAKPTCRVTLSSEYGLDIDGYLVYEGRVVLLPTPTHDNYIFEGWYLDAAHSKPYLNTPIEKDITLYAKWKKVNK